MKVCPICKKRFEGEDFICPLCGYSPILENGYQSFLPKIINYSDNFSSDLFSQLYSLEEGNFWFEARNDLLVWAFGKFFPSAKNFLEIGCGTGFVLARIYKEFKEVELFGCDVFNESFFYTKKRVSKVNYFILDARNIPFENEFDVIGIFDVIEHIDEDDVVLKQIFQAVKPKGGMILTVPQHQWLWSKSDELACHKRRYSRRNLIYKVKNAGFQIQCLTSFISLLFPMMVISRLRWRLYLGMNKSRKYELQQPKIFNIFFKKICEVERDMIKKGMSFPFGGSLLLIAKKNI